MESKDLVSLEEEDTGIRVGVRFPSLNHKLNVTLDSSEDSTTLSESITSSRSASMSPLTPEDAPLSGSGEPSHSPRVTNESTGSHAPSQRSTRAQGTAAVPTSKSKSGELREKRKRSRVTPEQLTHLERFFAADRSPTAARRKEISELLGMQERQTQIWFQNRRAKAKLLDGKKSRHLGGDWGDMPPDTPPQLSAGYEAELHRLIHEDHPVSIIPCTDLSIGSWRRIATGKHDLVAYVCEAKRCLTWFIHSNGYGFKMEIPFEIIVRMEFRNAAPSEGLASFHLSQPPAFFLEQIISTHSGGPVSSSGAIDKTWKKCSDWTEGMQASQVLRHDLIGSAVQLAHLLNELRERRSRSSISLMSPTAFNTGGMFGSPVPASSASMQIPQPPFASIQTGIYPPTAYRPAFLSHSRKRSTSGPPVMLRGLQTDVRDFSTVSDAAGTALAHPLSAGYAPTSFDRTTQSDAFEINRRSLTDYLSGGGDSSHVGPSMHGSPVPDFSTVPISHGATHRPFQSGSASTASFVSPAFGGGQAPPFQFGPPQPNLGTQYSHATGTPSPPLMHSSYNTTQALGIAQFASGGLAGALGQTSSSQTDSFLQSQSSQL